MLLIQCNRCPYKKGEFGHRHTLLGSVMWTEDRDWGDASTSQETPQIARRTVEAGKEPRPDLSPAPSEGAEPNQHLDLASKMVENRFLLFGPPILVLCYGRPRKLRLAPPIPKPETWEPPRPSLSSVNRPIQWPWSALPGSLILYLSWHLSPQLTQMDPSGFNQGTRPLCVLRGLS